MNISLMTGPFPLVLIGIIAVAVLVGFSVIFSIVQTRQKMNATKAWPYTEGRIIQCVVEKRPHTESYQTGNTRSTRTVYRYHPVVIYEYTVSGQPYVGRRIRYGGFEQIGYVSSTSAQDEAGRYPEGSIQPVYYNPAKPIESVLSQGQ
jgi:hypothetical protein